MSDETKRRGRVVRLYGGISPSIVIGGADNGNPWEVGAPLLDVSAVRIGDEYEVILRKVSP